jgi:2-amino-4-hydroxy-6-hydroxymethyldihydropteridine diphosphokinase
MARCLISFGANIGQPADTIAQAARLLRSRLADVLNSFQLSRLFRTPAVGGPAGQPPFVNAVAAVEVERTTAWEVWHAIREVEHALGRVRIERWEARRIDLDLLLFDDLRIWTQQFKLPHPRMVMRRFILEPALDVAADWFDPVSGMTIKQLAARLRQGPASIALFAQNMRAAQALLERAAAKSQSSWLTPRLENRDRLFNSCSSDPSPTEHAPSRWLGLLPEAALRTADAHATLIYPQPKLVCLLVEPVQTVGAAWEDVHRAQAAWMGLCTKSEEAGELNDWPVAGPRYLLATDDLPWAEHEIVAALEAMDCPVEVI